MATIASSSVAYCSLQDMANRFDIRPLGELLSDTGVPLSLNASANLSVLNALLLEASGELEAAATAGQRYMVGPSGPPTPTSAPALSTAATGGTVAVGTYLAVVTYLNNVGESLQSYAGSVITTGTTSTITVASPPGNLNATGWNAYLTQAGGTTYTLQNTVVNAIGTSFTLTAPPTSTGVNPPTTPVANQNDLMAIATSGTASQEFLRGIVCSLAYAYIWERRPEWIGGDPEKAGFRVKRAMDVLDALREGKMVFGTLEAQQAGLPQDEVESEQVLIQQRRTTKIGARLFGPRVSDFVGMNPPPHPYP